MPDPKATALRRSLEHAEAIARSAREALGLPNLWDAAWKAAVKNEHKRAAQHALETGEAEFLRASIAVWREIDRLDSRPRGLPPDCDGRGTAEGRARIVGALPRAPGQPGGRQCLTPHQTLWK